MSSRVLNETLGRFFVIFWSGAQGVEPDLPYLRRDVG
jgi:hypothetical protein